MIARASEQLSAHEIVMPRLTDSMEEGTVLRWLKQIGDRVAKGEPLAEVETDKATMSFESDGEGLLTEIVVAEGGTVGVGTVIARLNSVPAAAPSINDATGNGTRSTRPKASPLARRLAEQMGVDLESLAGSGPRGRITKADVELAANAPAREVPQASDADEPLVESPRRGVPVEPIAAPTPRVDPLESAEGAGELVELTRLQKTIARRMAASKATIPEFTLSAVIDMTEAVALRARLKELAVNAVAPSLNDIVIRACALALREFPRVNSSWEDGAVRLHPRVNVGVAVAADRALVVPTIFDADRKPVGEIAREMRELAQRVRDESITPPEIAGGTFTISNLGMYGIQSFTPVINPPQVALLALGAISRRPVFDDSGRVVPRDEITATLAADHRVLYGADAAQFMSRLREHLEQPLLLLAL